MLGLIFFSLMFGIALTMFVHKASEPVRLLVGAAAMGAATAAGSSDAPQRTTRMTPSPPIPARRSHSSATSSGARSPCTEPSGSGSSTKSFSVP